MHLFPFNLIDSLHCNNANKHRKEAAMLDMMVMVMLARAPKTATILCQIFIGLSSSLLCMAA